MTGVMEWLLGEDNPSVRYYTLRDLVGRPEQDPELAEARRAIMREGVVPEIVARIGSDDFLPYRRDFYSKYRGLSWQLLILAELGAERDAAITEACEYLMEHSQEKECGGFSVQASAKSGGRAGLVIPCLTGNMVFALIRFGYLDDPRVQHAIAWIARYQRFDDSEGEPPKGPPYDRMIMCWGKHSCHMGVVKVMKAFAEIPPAKRSPAVVAALEQGVEYILKHHVHKRSHDLSKVSKPGWLKFGFPLMYQTDVLEILEILQRLGVNDSRMKEAVEVVKSKQDDSGRWALENSYRNPLLVEVEKNGPSKWITMRALRVLGETR